MASLTDLINAVYGITKRPDLVVDTTLAVKSATLKAHQSGYYDKDLLVTGVIFDTSDYYQSLMYRLLLPRWRSLKFARKYSFNGSLPGLAGEFLTLITPDNSLDSYGINKENVIYLAGESLEIRSSTALQYILLGCYLLPDITDAGFNSWVALEHEYFIIFDAARIVYKGIGYDEQSAAFEKLANEQFQLLVISQTVANGY